MEKVLKKAEEIKDYELSKLLLERVPAIYATIVEIKGEFTRKRLEDALNNIINSINEGKGSIAIQAISKYTVVSREIINDVNRNFDKDLSKLFDLLFVNKMYVDIEAIARKLELLIGREIQDILNAAIRYYYEDLLKILEN